MVIGDIQRFIQLHIFNIGLLSHIMQIEYPRL